jgi:S-adenosylmethionine synthetase
VACAFVDRFVADLNDYLSKKSALVKDIRRIAEPLLRAPVEVSLKAADEPGAGKVFLTVTGTSAEAGDDGEVGRGNRANGLITPGRPMTMEATAGKNPVTHVGKLYNVAATLIADALVQHVPGVVTAECYLVSAIGSPVNQPRHVEIGVQMEGAAPIEPLRPEIETVVGDLLASIDTLWKRIIGPTSIAFLAPRRRRSSATCRSSLASSSRSRPRSARLLTYDDTWAKYSFEPRISDNT